MSALLEWIKHSDNPNKYIAFIARVRSTLATQPVTKEKEIPATSLVRWGMWILPSFKRVMKPCVNLSSFYDERSNNSVRVFMSFLAAIKMRICGNKYTHTYTFLNRVLLIRKALTFWCDVPRRIKIRELGGENLRLKHSTLWTIAWSEQ